VLLPPGKVADVEDLLPEMVCSGTPLQVVSSPEVLQLAVLGSFVNTMEKELRKTGSFLQPALGSSL
jgi:hypothetical protein